MPTVHLSPLPVQRFVDNNGFPLFNGKLYSYQAGTSTPQATYSDSTGANANPNPLTLNGRGEGAVWLADGQAYKFVLQDAFGNTIWTADNVIGPEVYGTAAAISTNLASNTDAAKGASLVGFNPTLNYAAGTIGKHVGGVEWDPTDYPWLAKFDGVTDDTAALLACLTAIYNAGGGVMRMPRGTARVTSLAFNWSATKSVHIVGAGKKSTILQKIGATTTPVLDLSADVGVLDTYSDLRDFAILGNAKTHPGLRTTRNARCRFSNLDIRSCDIAWDNNGGLIIMAENCTLRSNNQGYRSQKSGSIYANLVNFIGGEITLNTTYGVNLGECNGVHFYGVDIEGNGTSGNTATGNVNIAANVTTEIGASVIGWHGGWLESSLGTNMTVGAASGLQLAIEDTVIAGNEAGRILNSGAGVTVLLKNIISETPGDTVTLAGLSSTLINCTISVVTDTSAQQVYINSAVNAASALGSDVKNGQVRGVLTFGASGDIRSAGNFSANTRLVRLIDGQAAGNATTFFQTNGGGGNAAACSMQIGASGTTSRSINAGGTVNASGADYAEYETLVDGVTFSKGDVVGFNAAGLLTDRFDQAVTFGIKSTAPSYVGGDSWGVDLEGDAFESARAKVDRIAYAGKVPCNVTASLGDYIVPASDTSGRIIGRAVANPSFDEYRMAVGRVRSIGSDGRPVVVVKVL